MMKKVMSRIWILAMLTMVSTAAWAQDEQEETPPVEEPKTVKVDLNDSYIGGSVAVSRYSDPAEDGSVTVTITVTPDDGYIIAKDDIVVMPTFPSDLPDTRDGEPVIAEKLELIGDEPDDLSRKRDYDFIVPYGLGAWVMEAKFHFANDISGDENSEVAWRYDAESNALTIRGTGNTCDFGGDGFVDPWAAFRETVGSVLISAEVTGLGANIFTGCSSLTIITIENAKEVLSLGENAIPEGVDIDVPGNLYNEYKTTEGWMALNIISKEAVEMTDVEFGDNNQYDTFVNNEQAVVVPSVLSAYIITGIEDGVLVLSEVNVIPAGMPVLLFSKELKGNDFRTAPIEAEPTRMTNMLRVAPEGGQPVELGEVYLLYNDVFYYTQKGTIPENDVYLLTTLPNERTRFSYPLGSRGGTSGIVDSRTVNPEATSVWYSLDGHRLTTKPTRKGVYIMDGRKVVIK